MTNYSPLQKNTLDGLSETAGILYLKLCEKYQARKSAANERKAFFEACKYEEKAGEVFEYIMRNSPSDICLDDRTMTDLSNFMAERWRHNFIPSEALT